MLNYPIKIIIAFGEAISGNLKIMNWLLKNGYPELGALANAIQTSHTAYDWLVNNKFLHYAAFCSAVYNDENALLWLKKYKFDFLVTLAEASMGDDIAYIKLKKENNLPFYIIAKKIQFIRNQKIDDHYDYHKFR
jgi:hypothetical protein